VLGKGVKLRKGYGQGKNTVEVAKELEERYGIVEQFWNTEEDLFVGALEESFGDELEEVMSMEQPSKRGLSDEFTKAIEDQFRRNLQTRRYDGFLPNVPTKASTRDSRPSFIDSSLYMHSFRAWMEDVDD
jgi:hypothetical protein